MKCFLHAYNSKKAEWINLKCNVEVMSLEASLHSYYIISYNGNTNAPYAEVRDVKRMTIWDEVVLPYTSCYITVVPSINGIMNGLYRRLTAAVKTTCVLSVCL